MQMSKKKSSFCYMMDGKDVLQLPLYPPSHGTFRPFQMYCLVFGLLLVSRLLQYFKPQKFDTHSHVKHMFEQMFVPIFPMNGESCEQMVLSKTPIKTMHESVLQLEVFFGCECECQSQTLQTRKFPIYWRQKQCSDNCTHVMVVPVVQSTILNEMNSPMRQKNNGPGCEPLKAVIVSLGGYWGPPFDLIRNTKYIDTCFWKLNSITRWSYYQFPKDR